MIRVDRSRVELPSGLVYKLSREQQELFEFHAKMSAGSKQYQQQTFKYKVIRETHPFLKQLFANKCAYCESSLVGQAGDIENYRPKGAIEERDGKVLREGYWWLAHEWDNLHLACATCNRLHKRNKFPIAGARAEPMTKGVELEKEAPLLLDPCVDDPARFLSFMLDGTLRPGAIINPPGAFVKGASHYERAAATIDVLGLNRTDLVAARHRVRLKIDQLLRDVEKHPPSADELNQLLGIECPYRGAAQRWVADLLRRQMLSPKEIAKLLEAAGTGPVDIETLQPRPAPRKSRKAKVVKPRAIPKGPAHEILTSPIFGLKTTRPLPGPTLPEALVAKPVFIKRITIKNFKAVRDLDLTLQVLDQSEDRVALAKAIGSDADDDAAPASRTGWFVVLGENAVGKSSILEAIALTVMGRAHLQQLVDSKALSLAKLVHLQPGEDPERTKRTCIIRLTLVPEEHGEIELRITRTSFKFTKGGTPLPTLIRGYGFVRLPPRSGEDPDRTISLARCDNLFDPRAPLCDVDNWMTSLPYDKTKKSSFDIAASTILALLPQPATIPDVSENEPDTHLEPKDGRVVMTLRQRELSLDQLSSGYQSVIALAADIMSGIPKERLFDMREACGIVLLDEIGTQLHPRWRMHAIDDLRKAFPGMQFIATTHEPLCLKGVDAKEVAVLRRDGPEDDVTAIAGGFPNPRTLRIDQLLTSPYFGLDTTIDPDTDRLFQRYYEILAKGTNASTVEQTERRQLELKLAPHRGLGYTRSDRAVYELVDQFLAQEGADTQARAAGVSEDVRQQVFDIWRSVAARHRGPQ
jgi:uncharacterized protein (TIGR02646 family)